MGGGQRPSASQRRTSGRRSGRFGPRAALTVATSMAVLGVGVGWTLRTPRSPVEHVVPDPARQPRPVAQGLWSPSPGQQWQWQLTTPVDLKVNVPIYDIDGFDNSAAVVSELHAAGRRVICYIDVGAVEDYRPDASKLPASVIGRRVDGYPDERYLDIRQIGIIGPIMAARFDMCKAKGFDAVEPDVLDAYANNSGFPLSVADQLAYNDYIAGLVHARGMSVALKNDPELSVHESTIFDFSIDEQCVEYSECDELLPFITAGKAVLHVEYNLPPSQFCPITMPLGFSSMRKDVSLDAWREPC